jgi:two-component system invasion response regulator UvrY
MSSEKITIAIADDHALVRRGLSQMLQSYNFHIIAEASNGSELLKLIKENPPVVVLLDINMPVMDGISTMHQIQNMNLPVKVLALSMMDDDGSVIRMIKAGAKGYLLKDSEPEELIQAIRIIADNGFYYSERIAGRISSLQFNSDSNDHISKLSQRELDFLVLASSDLSYKEIADKMIVSVRTVDGYRDSIYEKLKIHSRIGLVLYAIRHKIVRIDD